MVTMVNFMVYIFYHHNFFKNIQANHKKERNIEKKYWLGSKIFEEWWRLMLFSTTWVPLKKKKRFYARLIWISLKPLKLEKYFYVNTAWKF